MAALDRMEEQTGKSVYDVFAYMLYNPKTQDSVKASLWNSFQELMVIKETKTTVELNEHREVIILPPIKLPKIIDIKNE